MKKLLLAFLIIFISIANANIEDGKKAFDKKDYEKAQEIFLKIAQEGMVAKFNLGYMYELGLGVEKDAKKAISFYTLSANDGYDVAQNTMGNAYLKGVGVEKNLKLAIFYYQLAAKQGNKEAIQTLKLIQKKIDENKSLGYIQIRSNVSNDKVFIDGKFVGKSSTKYLPITAGVVHNIRVEKDGYNIYEFQPVNLKKDEKRSIRAVLTRKQ